jgi:hypothetical protein
VEQSISIGVVVLVGALVFSVGGLTRRRWVSRSRSPVSPRVAVLILGAIAAVAVIFSAPPTARVLGVTLHFPSDVVFRFGKFWRAYARFFIVAHLAFVALASLGLASALAGRSRAIRAVAATLVVSAIAFESLTFPPRSSFSYAISTPRLYRWLRSQPVDTVAEYPMLPAPSNALQSYLTFQPVHGKRLVNDWRNGTPADDLRLSIAGIADPATLPMLRAFHTDLVLVHSDRFGQPHEFDAPGLIRVRRIGDVTAYRIPPGPVAGAGVALLRNFGQPEMHGWESFRWMRQGGVIEVVNVTAHAQRAAVSLQLESFGPDHTVTIRQRGVTLWEGRVSGPTPVRFVAAVGVPMIVHASPRPIRIDSLIPALDDDRIVSVGLSRVSAAPVD